MSKAKRIEFRAELQGLKFNRLQVIERFSGSLWKCVCDCGKEIYVNTYQLKSGKTKSCGCFTRDRMRKHGMEGTPTYNTWGHMLSRCRNVKHKQYADYGGRGITVCERWLEFSNFLADMGEKPEGMSLDRIDNDGSYTPENCRWVNQKSQVRNRRVSPKFEYKGQSKSLAELCEELNLPWRRIYERIRTGWDIEKALETPIRKKEQNATSI